MLLKTPADEVVVEAPPRYSEATPGYAEFPLTWTTEAPRHMLDGHHAHASLALPLDVEELFVMARGLEHSRGDFEISLTGGRGPDIAVMDVDVTYHHEHALDGVTICHLKPREGKQGLGIFTRTGHDRSGFGRSPHFHVHLRLPTPADAPNIINHLSTDLPAFTHHFRNLGGGVIFRKVKLETSLCAIEGETLEGDEITLITSNSPVRGDFRVSKSLDIETTNAPMSIHARLMNYDEAKPTHMSIRTTNGRVEAAIALESGTSTDRTGGAFRVTAQTTNAPTSVFFERHPVDACLDGSIQTNNSPARVTMHPAFEGRFQLRTSPYIHPAIHEMSSIEDPAGRGRVRKIGKYSGMGDVHGRVWWEQLPGMGAEEKGVRNAGHITACATPENNLKRVPRDMRRVCTTKAS
ncbi:hypothetical protein C8T65DRAFT_726954 [Cerioporus squamosus]|nr:hypothetical protein C8T65DRAFT_726954 [Cerioporus squamosus]